MVDTEYDSALPVRGNLKDGALVDADNTMLIIGGTDTSNYQAISVDATGNVNTNVKAITAGTNTIGKVYVTDGTSDLPIAEDGATAKTKGIQVLGIDGAGNGQILLTDTTGALVVNTTGGASNTATHNTILLVKATPNTVVSQVGAKVIKSVEASGSGLMKVEIKWGTTASETTKVVLFNSSANRNVFYEFPDGLSVSGSQTILVSCTNLEPSASPASDFTGYGTILTE